MICLIVVSVCLLAGNWSYGKQHGHGVYKYADGTIYEGDFKFGKMTPPDDAPRPDSPVVGYVGDLNEKGEKHGHGVFRYDNNDIYEGDWIENRKEGHGIYKYSNGDVYEGELKDGLKHGRGVYNYVKGKE